MSRLALLYLGPPHVELDGAPVTLSLAKAHALLAYLAVTGEAHSREALATLLWPESDAEHARASLRGVLREINASLGSMWLHTERAWVGLDAEARVWIDVAAFERGLDAAPARPEAVREAADLYRGDFMAGFSLNQSVAFEEWQFFQAERLRHMLDAALAQLSWVPEGAGPAARSRALAYARRWVALDPLSEAAHQRLIRLYLAEGQRAEALRQYETYAQTMERELGVAPAQDILDLYWSPPGVAALIHPALALRTVEPPPDPALDGDASGRDTSGRDADLSAPHTLPTPLTPFVGREAERAEIGALLRGEDLSGAGRCRLLTLVGPGGVGKTRLAIRVAHDVADAFEDGVIFVPLDSVDYPSLLAPVIAEALDALPYGADAAAHLRRVLSSKNLLLVLDNFDYLVEGAGLLADVLQAAPGLTMLVTSQEPLNVQGEWQFPVRGLPVPEEGRVLEESSAAQMFLQCARRADAGFRPAEDDWPRIARICRLVDGLPLGIELAATWVRLLSCAEIEARIARSLEFLATALHGVPDRHRSLRAVFDHTWHLLSAQERRVFRQVSVFVGGFRQEAAEQVAGASLPLLCALTDRGLLRRHPDGRYDRHPLLWWYAAEKLEAAPEEREAARDRHCAYYAAFLYEQALRLRGHTAKQVISLIEPDLDNVRTAWHWAGERPELDTAQTFKAALRRFEETTGVKVL